jgi:primosomal protein N'
MADRIFTLRSRAVRARTTSLVDVSLDAAQRVAIELPAARPLLVLGEAGHGKTTVLLHRIARVVKANRSVRGLVLVPTEGLVRLLVPLLRRLGVDLEVLTRSTRSSRGKDAARSGGFRARASSLRRA